MATFSGGEAITAVKTLSVGAGASEQTVPTGKYWEFQVRNYVSGDFSVNGIILDSSYLVEESRVYWANAGEVVSQSTGTVEIIVKEYNKPA